MEALVYLAIWYSLLLFSLYAAYSNHRTAGAIAGIGFILLGIMIFASPLETIVGEVITYAS